MSLKAASLNSVRALLLGATLAIVFPGGVFAAGPAVHNPAAAKLLARLTNLSEMVPDETLTAIDLFGAASPALTVGGTYPPAFHVTGKILSLVDTVKDGADARGFIIIDDSQPDEWQEIGFLRTSKPDEQRTEFELTEYPAADQTKYLKWTSVRFYNGRIDGIEATLVFYANRDLRGIPLSGAAITPTPVSFVVYELQADTQASAGRFARIAEFASARKYCNADLALFRELNLTLPSLYQVQQITADSFDETCKAHW